ELRKPSTFGRSKIMVGNDPGCPVCDSTAVTLFLRRERVPIHQNLLMREQQSAVNVPRGDLNLRVCEDCGFIFNESFDPSASMYGQDYENTQAYSPSFEEYMNGLVRHLVIDRNVQNCDVVEVGCGNGLFLRKLVLYEGAGNRGFGFDPSYSGSQT